MQTLGEKIRELRLQRGLTQTGLGEGLVTPSMISQIEADRAKPSNTLIIGLANRLGMPVEYFVENLEDQQIVPAYIRLAEYYILCEQPVDAENALNSVTEPTTPGLDYYEYHLLLTKSWRMQRKLLEASRLTEELRENAYRFQDQRLLFQVFKESGYIEYAMDNLNGAMHEWTRALKIGESLVDPNRFQVDLQQELTELLLSMDFCNTRMGELAQDYLRRATVFSSQAGRFRDISVGLIADARESLERRDNSRAKVLTEKAISVVQSARFIEDYILVHTKLQDTTEMDAWNQSALATASVNPVSFIEAELVHIQQLIQSNEVHLAERRVVRCLEILEDYRREVEFWNERAQTIETRLFLASAQLNYLMHNQEQAIAELQTMGHRFESINRYRDAGRIWSQLITWYGESRQIDAILDATKHLQICLDDILKPED